MFDFSFSSLWHMQIISVPCPQEWIFPEALLTSEATMAETVLDRDSIGHRDPLQGYMQKFNRTVQKMTAVILCL